MMILRRRLACCTRDREISLDFDKQERIMTYDGLESCIINNQSYENESGTSRGEGCVSDSFDDDGCSSSSSSKDVYGSFSSKWLTMKKDEHGLNDWDLSGSPQHLYDKEKPCYSIQYSDVETMKEKFAKLLLGEDITGGRSGLSTALALSNAITNLAATVFGELWKLEPLPEERKAKWQREMDWLLSPTNYMVELVPAKQNCANGRILEIMTPKARADIHVNLPALQKLDSMLIDTLDAMVNTEFWYSEVGSRAEGRTKSSKQSKRWWLPLPQVPTTGLSDQGRKKLLNQSKVMYQVFKAAKSVNENILLEMPVPAIIKDALTKSGKANLGEELYKVLTADSNTAAEMLNSLNLKSEHSALDAINKLEAAIFAWKERVTAQASGRSPVRTSWSFVKDSMSEFDKMESLLDTYSRVLGNVAFSILSRIADIMQEDSLTNPGSPAATCCFPGGVNSSGYLETPCRESNASHISDQELSYSEARTSSVMATPSRSRVWCIGGDACRSLSPANSPLTERSRGI
ncbi:rop guanine nucleotide exchange factor [Salix suchowensis]|nr:rop guanine nucleotide exchange factor [Salix suchowensis]